MPLKTKWGNQQVRRRVHLGGRAQGPGDGHAWGEQEHQHRRLQQQGADEHTSELRNIRLTPNEHANGHPDDDVRPDAVGGDRVLRENALLAHGSVGPGGDRRFVEDVLGEEGGYFG